MQYKFNVIFTLYCVYLYKFYVEQYMRALLMCFLASVSLQYGYLYAENSDDVDVEDVEDEEEEDNSEGEPDEDEEDEENDDDGESKKVDKKSQTSQNVKLKIANNNTALSANLNNVEQAKLDQKEEEKRKALEAKKAKEKQLKEEAARMATIGASIKSTLKELEIHAKNPRFDARNRSFFRKLYAEFSNIEDYINEFGKKGVEKDIVLAYINITIDDIYFVTAEANTVGISDIVKQTISEILYKTAEGKIVLEWLKDISDVKMLTN